MKALLCAPILTVTIHSCGPSATSGGFDSPNPGAKMYAIEHAARDGDRGALKNLIEQLDSADPGVRAMSISALRRLTGETYGYHDYDPPYLRRPAIERWFAALQKNEIPTMRAAPSEAAPENGSGSGHE